MTAKKLKAAILNAIVFVLLDRVQLLAWPRSKQLPEIPGFVTDSDSFVHKQTSIRTYRRVRSLRNPKTGTMIFMQYRPAAPWLAPIKLTIITEAKQGLSRAELLSIAAAFNKVCILLVELAIDFAPDSHVGRTFILSNALFGKSQPRPANHATLHYGARRSEIMARAYRRKDDWFRTENESHSSWLRRNHISEIADLARLPALLLPKHFAFFNVDYQRLRAHLARKNALSADQIVAQCRHHAASLHGLLNYLRDEVGLTNVRRFLRLHPLNQAIQNAAFDWAKKWISNSHTD